MSTLLLGAGGQLGRHLNARMAGLVTCARQGGDHAVDLSRFERVRELLDRAAPGVIVNAAAWTAVDDAEDNEAAALRLNGELPGLLAEWCRERGALLVHYSTDYVFSGAPGRPWRENDPVAPESAYGRTKLAGEQAIMASGCRALVLRTAWVYSALPGNFVSAILRRAGQGQALKVVADQTGSPTWAGTLAAATRRLLERAGDVDRPLLMHVSGQGAASWYDLARRAVQLAAASGFIPEAVDVEPIGSDQWPQKATRPAWSVLDGGRYERFTGEPLPGWDDALAECLDRWSQAPC